MGDLLDKNHLLSLGEIDPELKAVPNTLSPSSTIPADHFRPVPREGQPSTCEL